MEINKYIAIAKGKIANKALKTFILAIYAGAFIALAGIASTVVSTSIKSYSIAKLLSGLIFPIGLIMVVLMKTELFTGNSLLIIPFLNKEIKLKQLLKNWLIVYFGNLVGALIVSVLIYNTPLVNTLKDNFINIANTKVSFSFLSAMILGFFCNILVCLAVYLTSIAENITEKILVIIFPIMLFIVLSFEHSVANMFYLSIGYLLNNDLTIGSIIINNLLPVTLGNIIGGVILGTTIWYLRKDK